MKIYELQFKIYAVKYYHKYRKKQKIENILQFLDISRSTLYSWVKLYKDGNLYESKPKTGYKKITEGIKNYIIKYVRSKPLMRYNNLIRIIKKKYNIEISISHIYKILSKINFKRKKVKIVKVSPKSKKKEHKKLFKIFKKKIQQINQNDIISIDESSFDTTLIPSHGWIDMPGKKIEVKEPPGRIRVTLTMAICNNKVIHYDIIKGSSTAFSFMMFLFDLDAKIQNKYLLLDNAPIHTADIVKCYMKLFSSNKMIFNVPYSPNYNPIENVFSKLKSFVKYKLNNRTMGKLTKNIIKGIKQIKKRDLKNMFTRSTQEILK